MIEKLRIKGFQVHEDLTIELDPFITTIIANTDAGKSSIIRALRWLSLNKPQSDSFVNWDSDYAQVILKIDGHVVSRKRGNGTNLYKADGQTYRAFGTGVPDEISKLLNLGEENFQLQHSDPYWFMRTGGDLAKELNRIVNLELIDNCLGNITSEVRKVRSAIGLTEERLETARKQAKDLSWVVGASEDLVKLEETAEQADKIKITIIGLTDLLCGIWRDQQELEKANLVSSIGREVVKTGNEIKDISENKDRLQLLVTNIRKLEKEQCEARRRTEEKKEKLKKNLDGRCPLCRQTLPKAF